MTNAQGGKFVISSMHTTRPPMSEARRQQIHGRILPMDRPLKDEGTGYDHLSIWDEQPTWRAGVGLLGLIAVLGALAIVAFHKPASPASPAPEASTVSAFEARADGNGEGE